MKEIEFEISFGGNKNAKTSQTSTGPELPYSTGLTGEQENTRISNRTLQGNVELLTALGTRKQLKQMGFDPARVRNYDFEVPGYSITQIIANPCVRFTNAWKLLNDNQQTTFSSKVRKLINNRWFETVAQLLARQKSDQTWQSLHEMNYPFLHYNSNWSIYWGHGKRRVLNVSLTSHWQSALLAYIQCFYHFFVRKDLTYLDSDRLYVFLVQTLKEHYCEVVQHFIYMDSISANYLEYLAHADLRTISIKNFDSTLTIAHKKYRLPANNKKKLVDLQTFLSLQSTYHNLIDKSAQQPFRILRKKYLITVSKSQVDELTAQLVDKDKRNKDELKKDELNGLSHYVVKADSLQDHRK